MDYCPPYLKVWFFNFIEAISEDSNKNNQQAEIIRNLELFKSQTKKEIHRVWQEADGRRVMILT